MQQLGHEKLEVYQISITFLALAYRLIDEIPRGNCTEAHQLKRASQSIVLNIAEAAGYPSDSKKKYHYAISRGSALECGAALDILNVMQAVSQDDLSHGKGCLVSIVSMLTKMCRP